MTLRISTGLANYISGMGSLKSGLNNGRIEIYSGVQPSTADSAISSGSVLLCTITNASGALTNEVLSQGQLALSGTASGSCTALTVNGVDVLGGTVSWTSLAQGAINIAAQINNFQSVVEYTAAAVGNNVVITALPGTGTGPNGYVVAATVVTSTGTPTNMGSLTAGVAAINGLKYSSPSAGVISIFPGQVWSGLNVASGTAGWFRAYGSVVDTGALDANLVYNRMDGAIATSGAEMNGGTSTAFAASATTTITTWSAALPTF